MRRPTRPLAAALAGLALVAVLGAPAVALADGTVSDGILVTMRAPAAGATSEVSLLSDASSALDAAGVTVTDLVTQDAEDGTVTVEAQPAEGQSDEEALAAAESLPGVTDAQLNYIYELIEPVEDDSAPTATPRATPSLAVSPLATFLPNDPYAQISDPNQSPNQYWLYSAGLDDAWALSRTQGDVTIVTIDSGAQLDHPDLADNILSQYAWDAFNDQPLSQTVAQGNSADPVGHGTMVAGIAAAVANNATGVAGASYNAKVIPVKVLPDDGSSRTGSAELIRGYEHVVELVESGEVPNIRVVNMSLGGYSENINDERLHELIQELRDMGIVTVCAGGNGDYHEPNTDSEGNYQRYNYPGDFEECVSVTALEPDGTNLHWSDYNEAKDISAPGVDIWTTTTTSRYTGSSSGTSLSAPIVSGTAALMFAAEPEATVDQVLDAMYQTAVPVVDPVDDRTQTSGSHGALDAGAALAYLQESLEEDEPVTTFPDVQEGDWFYDVVSQAAAHGFMNGNGDGTFAPLRKLTRAEVACVLYNLSGETLPQTEQYYDAEAEAWKTGFPDVVGDQFYSQAVTWCRERGVINGNGDGTFRPDQPLSRQEFACMLANYASVIDGKSTSMTEAQVEAALSRFPDAGDVVEWARTGTAWVASLGIMGNDGSLSPANQMDRATCAAMLVNYAL